MSTSLIQLAFYFSIGVIWNIYRPMNMDAMLVRRALTALIFSIMIPLYSLLWLWNIRLDFNLLKFVLVGVFSVMLNFLAVWYLIKNKRWPNIVKGSLIIALSFSAVFTHGMPILTNVVGSWTSRLSIEMYSLVMMPMALSVGSLIAYRFSEKKQPVPVPVHLFKQPIFWLPLMGLLFNVADFPQPQWLQTSLNTLLAGIVPIMVITAGLAMKWQRNWTRIAMKIWPYLLVPVLVTPLTVWGSVVFLGGFGPNTATSMLMLALMPTSLLGFYLCEQYRLELATYHIAYTLSMVFSLVLLPALYYAIQSGWIKT